MSITFDGHRSLRRKHVAKSLLERARMLGVPSLSSQRDGFTYRVVNLDPDLEMGRVTSPMGAVVACSTTTGIEIATADYWAGGFNPKRDAYVLKNIEGAAGQITTTIQGIAGVDLERTKYEPPNPTVPPTNVSPGVCTPVVSSFFDETYVIALTGRHKSNVMVSHLGSSFYFDAGQAEKSLVFSSASNASRYFTCSTAIKSDGGLSLFVAPIEAWHLLTGFKPYVVGDAFWMTAQGLVSYATLQSGVAYQGFPTSVRDPLTYFDKPISNNRPSHPRTYGYQLKELSLSDFPTTVQIVRADNINFPSEDDSPEYDLMMPIINWSGGISGIVVQTSGIRAFCDAMFGVATRTITQLVECLVLFFGYPCARDSNMTAADSVLVPVDDNVFYAWTRSSGIAKFDATGGISKVSAGFSVPTLVSATAGLRPNITQSEPGRYFCVCETTTGVSQVLGLATGSPFTGWTDVQMPTDTLLHARPIKNSATEIVVLGVLADGDDRYFGILRENEGAGSWVRLGKLPFAANATAKWSACLYGIGPWVQYQQEYMQPPPMVHGDVG